MKPETILQSDLLDIIFEGRNKEYGAYALRKNYNHRLIQAIGIMMVVASTVFIVQNIQLAGKGPVKPLLPPDTHLSSFIELQPEKPKEKPEPKSQPLPAKAQPTIQDVVPIIKPNITETTVPSIENLDGRIISTVTNTVPPGGGDNVPVHQGTPAGQTTTTEADPVATPKGPVDFAEVMPSFNGDIVRYMLHHLRQPDDLEDGERIVVRVKFVVNEDGNIGDVEVVQSGRRDLDEEVVRVIRKMPRWNPGKQAGKPVPVFFNMPVTFVSNP
jgi:protein TonB